MKYDCNKTLDFGHELNRMCETSKSCSDCPLNCNCGLNEKIAQKEIDIVQSWSDEHQEETMLEHFKKLFPNAPYNEDQLPEACPKELGWTDNKNCNDFDCSKCWNEPYKED